MSHASPNTDEFNWLRDDSRSAPHVLDHLAEENAAAKQVLPSFQHLQDSFHSDIAARVPLVERLPAERRGSHWYYKTREEGDQYWRLWRGGCSEATLTAAVGAKGGDDDAGGSQAAVCILDPNTTASDADYWDMGSWDVSQCGTRLAYTRDTQGDEGYAVMVRDLAAAVDLVLVEAASVAYGAELFWGPDAETLFCVEKAPGSMAAHSLVRLRLCRQGSQEALVEASLLYSKAREEDSFEAHLSRDGKLLLLHVKDQDGASVAIAPLASLAACAAPSTRCGTTVMSPGAGKEPPAGGSRHSRLPTCDVTRGSGPSTSGTSAGTCTAHPAVTAAPAAAAPPATPGAEESVSAQEPAGRLPVHEGQACSGSEPLIPGRLDGPWRVAVTLDEEEGDLLWVDHWRGCWLGIVDTDKAPNGCVCQLGGGSYRVLAELEAGCEVEQVQVSSGHMVVLLRHRCQFKLLVLQLVLRDAGGGTLQVTATKLWERQLPVEAGSVSLLPGAGFDTPVVWVQQSGLVLPVTVVQFSLDVQAKEVVHVEEVAGGFDSADYTTELLWVERDGGVEVPVHVAYHRQRFRQDGTSPLLLHGYGAYGKKLDPSFNPAELPLLDRGWAVAIAHVRGGGELGWQWHADGRRFQKHNTFEDLVACVDYLVACRYCCPASIVGWGRSAGGLTMGAALNLRPDLFQGLVLDVPFLDPLNTMMDPSLPLTVKERAEWGDPLDDEEVREYMRSYSPYETIQQAAYPHMLLTAGLHDHRVNYWEPAKYIARLRQRRTDSSRMLLLLTSGKQGHFASSGAGDRLQERALKYAFFAKALGLRATDGFSATAAGCLSTTKRQRTKVSGR